MSINTILFDLDGTLINTNDLIMASFRHTFEHFYPGRYEDEELKQFIGEPLYLTFAKHDESRAEEMVAYYREHNIANHDKLVTEFDGVFETVKTLSENGYKLAIVTSKMRNTVEMGLKLTELDQFFPVVITVDEVENPKPHPEQLETAMKELRSVREETIMVGDSQYDILAGQNAGVTTVGVSWTIKGSDFLASFKPDYLVDHMGELLEIAGVEK
ncbi:pyrophosphatase PpaX [Anaerobacillus sp. 1_MG-2023]|uniref:pyrophosphatase PpaX n=1 Tax=Anaerobacillus sp. 1_MG-2023 TaxID=3062655 RepID=UPI0026E2A343|nr:pyrophosphatase PpaX [Anaerobacillus sp. 1_MG-2023]MDO6657886.1 pyrophosphatase PpaX [Anaerobacillus sp. 1_MG-2023]